MRTSHVAHKRYISIVIELHQWKQAKGHIHTYTQVHKRNRFMHSKAMPKGMAKIDPVHHHRATPAKNMQWIFFSWSFIHSKIWCRSIVGRCWSCPSAKSNSIPIVSRINAVQKLRLIFYHKIAHPHPLWCNAPHHLPPTPPLRLLHSISIPFMHSFILLLVLHTIFVGSIPNINNIIDVPPTVTSSEPRQSFVDKIHGITDKLQSLSHLGGHDSTDSKSSKSGKIPLRDQILQTHLYLSFFLYVLVCVFIIQNAIIK